MTFAIIIARPRRIGYIYRRKGHVMSETNEQQLLHYTAYLCERYQAQFLGQVSYVAATAKTTAPC